MKKIVIAILSLMMLFILTGCGSKNTTYQNISYDEYTQKVENNETFLLFLWQTGCSHCEAFEPTLNKVIKANNLEVYGLNLAEVTEEQYEVVKNKTFMTGTPTLVYFKDGKNESKLIGEQSESELNSFLKKIGYIKEK